MKLTYAVVIEQTPSNYCAYVPDVPGCISVGDTLEEMRAMIREALAFHIEGAIEDGEAIPEPTMSIEEATAYHNQEILEAALEGYPVKNEADERPPRFELIEVEISPALAATA